MNFPTIVPYLDLLIRNGLAGEREGEIPRYMTTRKGAKALRHFQEIEKLIPEKRRCKKVWREGKVARHIITFFIFNFISHH